MATLRYALGGFSAMSTLMRSDLDAGGEHTTSGTATTISGATARTGQVIRLRCDGAVWVAFGGQTAAVGTDHYLPANETMHLVITQPGAISVIDDS